MLISIHSDLHFNDRTTFADDIFVKSEYADVIILAGDITEGIELLSYYIEKVKENNPLKPIIFIPGNHEYEGEDFYEAQSKMRSVCEKFVGVYLLDNDFVEISGVEFIGSTLWTDFRSIYAQSQHYEWAWALKEITEFVCDFRMIKNNGQFITPDFMVERFKRSHQFIAKRLKESTASKKVVITHFAPHPDLCNVKFIGDTLTPYFNADARDLFKLKPDAWIWGHTHCNHHNGASINGVRCLTNQRGFSSENTGYNKDYLVEI